MRTVNSIETKVAAAI